MINGVNVMQACKTLMKLLHLVILAQHEVTGLGIDHKLIVSA